MYLKTEESYQSGNDDKLQSVKDKGKGSATSNQPSVTSRLKCDSVLSAESPEGEMSTPCFRRNYVKHVSNKRLNN